MTAEREPGPAAPGEEERPVDLQALRAEFLQAREQRDELARRLCVQLPGSWPGPVSASAPGSPPGAAVAAGAAGEVRSSDWCLVLAGTSIPGVRKEPAGLEIAFNLALEQLARSQGIAGQARQAGLPARLCGGHDALGPYEAWSVRGDPRQIKAQMVQLEDGAGWGRLLDLDVFTREGKQIGRSVLGLPPRRCLACEEPAVDCMRAGRHGEQALLARVEELLAGLRRAE